MPGKNFFPKGISYVIVLILAITSLLSGCSSHTPETGSPPVPLSPSTTTPAPATTSDQVALLQPSGSIAQLSQSSSLTMLSISQGNVLVLKSGSKSWINAPVGTTLGFQDQIQAGKDSDAVITFFDGSTIELKAGSQIEVSSLGITSSGSTTILLKQQIGDTISHVNKLVDSASRYEVETPQGVAAVRGSAMEVTVSSEGVTTVVNIEGTIYAVARGIEVNIPQGMQSIIATNEAPSQPVPAPTPALSPSPSPTQTPSPSPEATPSPTPTLTPSPSPSPSPKPTQSGGGWVSNPVIISTVSFPNGEVGINYNQSLIALRGWGPYRWYIVNGSLPTGLSLNMNTGAITGIPTTAETANFTIQVRDNIGITSKVLSIIIEPALNITTASLANDDVGVPYNQTLAASGGYGSRIWSVKSGVLPDGLSLNAGTGAVTGTPTASVSASFIVQVIDGMSALATKPLSITIDPEVSVTTSSLANGTVGTAYSQTLPATGGSGNYTWSITSGNLPDGISLNGTTGVINGTPINAGTANFMVQVSDGVRTAQRSLSIVINPATSLVITTASLPEGEVGVSCNQTLTASGGVSPYIWSITSGSLPDGISLNGTTGVISGTPPAAVSANFTAQVMDSVSANATRSLSLTIYPCLSISTSSLPGGTVGTAFSQNLIATGGSGTYSWSITSGNLSAGISLNGTTGVINGTPATAGTANFTVQVSDGIGATAQSFSIKINSYPISNIIYVKANASGANNGSSWTNAFIDLQSALGVAVSGQQIWVAAGTYKPSVPVGGSDDRHKAFLMKNSVGIYGGFDGTESSLDTRNARTNVTILSGDIGTPGDSSDNCYHVINNQNSQNGTAVLDGFTITRGNASGGDTAEGRGGGMYNLNTSPTVINCIFSNNTASHAGGGLQNSGSACPVIINCQFNDNTGAYGGGVENESSGGSFSNCQFTGNIGTIVSGGMHNWSGTVTLTGCTFSNNATPGDGGAVGNYQSASVTIVNNIFSNNNASNLGGGIFNELCSASIMNCTFYNNSASQGGAIRNTETGMGSPQVTNSIFWSNTPDQIVDGAESATQVTYSDVQGGYSGSGNFNSDPLFVNSSSGNLQLTPLSPCIDEGTNVGAPTIDIGGNIRPYDGNNDGTATTDIGAYEWHGVYSPLTITTSTLPDGEVGVTYNQTLVASSGNAPYTWSIASGSLPAGVSLNGTTGVISGTPAVGTNNFTVQVIDSASANATKPLSLTIYPPLSISTSSLPDGTIGTAYSQTLAATGGSGTYTWSITSGTLLNGVTLNGTTGVISGTPTTAGTSSFTVQVGDGIGTASQNLIITILNPGTFGVFTWGYNYDGELGNGSILRSSPWGVSTPAQVNSLSGVISAAGGGYDSYVLKSDGTVWSCGYGGDGELGNGTNNNSTTFLQVSGLSDVATISSGDSNGLALKSDGTVWAWGYCGDGELGNGTTTNSNIPVQVNGLSGVTAIAAGYYHGLALKSDGTVWAWGYGRDGELGNGTNSSSNIPIQVNGLSNVIAIDGGGDWSLALKSDGTVCAWGYGGNGELGNGTNTNSNIPTQVTGLIGVTAISAGGCHSLALKSDGTVWAWGYGRDGELGNGTTSSSNIPVQVSGLSDVSAIATGDEHSLALKRDGTAWTWGYGGDGELGNGAYNNSSTPVQVSGLVNVAKISSGEYHSLAIGPIPLAITASLSNSVVGSAYTQSLTAAGGTGTYTWSITAGTLPAGVSLNSTSGVISGTSTTAGIANFTVQVNDGSGTASKVMGIAVIDSAKSGNIYAWGVGGSGQLGNATNANSNIPVKVKGLSGIISVAGGNADSLAVKSDGTVWAWGMNYYGQLGNGTTINSNIPVQVSGLTGFVAVNGGWAHSLALKSDGTVWDWGYNGQGQLGNGTNANSYYPVQVSGLSGVIAIAEGYYGHNLALKSDGTVWTWGYNGSGQLGNGTTANSNTPVQVSGLSSVTAIAAGYYSSLALKSDGTVWAWGNGGDGELGNGSNSNSSVPVQVSGITGVTAIAASEYNGFAVKPDGTAWAWGNGSAGELGNGSNSNSNVPVLMTGINGVSALAGGEMFTLVLKSDGTVWGCGDNSNGQLGNGTQDYCNVPIQVANLASAIAVAGGHYHTLAIYTPQPLAIITSSLSDAEVNGTYHQTVRAVGGTSPFTWSISSGNLPAGLNIDTSTGVISGTPTSISGPTALTITVTDSDGGTNSRGFNITVNPALAITTAFIPGGNTGTAYSQTLTATGGVIPYTWSISTGTLPSWATLDPFSGIISGIPDTAGITNITVQATDGQGTVRQSLIIATYDPAAGNLLAWGSNGYGQLGDGLTSPANIPVQANGLSGVIAISGGYGHTLALKSDGTVWAWGLNYCGELGNGNNNSSSVPVRVAGLTGIIAVSAGHEGSLALKSNGTVWAWGNTLGNGTGNLSNIPVQVSGLTAVNSVSAGDGLDLALKADGTVWAWGADYFGQLGTGTNSNSNVPLQVNGLSGITAIAAGSYGHCLALKSDGSVWAWGYDAYGELGNGTFAGSNVPVQVNNLTGAVSIAAGAVHSLALKADGTVWAWGDNSNGELGNGTNSNSNIPVQVSNLSGITAISADGDSSIGGLSLALKADGSVWSWGYNYWGQLGNGYNIDSNIPVRVCNSNSMMAIEAGGDHCLEISGTRNLAIADASLPGCTTGTPYYQVLTAYGSNNGPFTWSIISGSLPDGLTIDGAAGVISGTPTTVGNSNFTVQVTDGLNTSVTKDFSILIETPVVITTASLPNAAIGTAYSQSLTATGGNGIYTWSVTAENLPPGLALSNSTGVVSGTPITSGVSNFTIQASDGIGTASQSFSITVPLVLSFQSAYSWGYNAEGELGNGTNSNSNLPVEVNGLTGVIAIAGGSSHNLALKSDGTVWAWGYNNYGQLGNNSGSSNTAVRVNGLSGVTAIAAGAYHSLALKSDGTVWAWGYNYFGELGVGPGYGSTYYPVQVSNLSGVTAIAAGGEQSLALKSDGSVWAWGSSVVGNTAHQANFYPYQVSGLSSVSAIAVGSDDNLVLKSDGSVWAWGNNWYGQLGSATNSNTNVPTQVNGLSGVSGIAEGGNFSLALKPDGSVWDWGSNHYGQLGNSVNKGTDARNSTPAQVSGLSGITSIAAGSNFSLALKSDGSVCAWGYNGYGELGNGTTVDSAVPIQVSELVGITVIAAGGNCGLAIDGTP